MADPIQKGSVRQLPAGKFSNIKKIFEDGDDSANKGEKPSPPARPPPPPSRVKSPVRQQPLQQTQPKIPAAQQQTSIAAQASNQASRFQDHKVLAGSLTHDPDGHDAPSTPNKIQPQKEVKKLSSTVTGRFAVSLDTTGPSPISSHNLQKRASSPSAVPQLKSAVKHLHESALQGSSGTVDKPRQDSQADKNLNKDVSDLYAKVNKARRDTEPSMRKTVFISEGKPESDFMSRREAIRKKATERRKTIPGCEAQNEEVEICSGTVAERTKLFAGSKVDKPAFPQKPDSLRRKLSMKSQKESESENNFHPTCKTDSNSDQDSFYQPPWDMQKISVLEKLKKTQPYPPAVNPLPRKSDSSNNPIKSPPPPKPSTATPSRKSDMPLSKSENKNNETMNAVTLVKPKQAESTESTPQQKVAPPPKPPRTHAHDDYLRVKPSSVNSDVKSSSSASTEAAAARKTVHIMDVSKSEDPDEPTEYLSIKDRVSKLNQQQTDQTPEVLKSALSNKNTEPSVAVRSSAPSRPPPPKRRPNSDEHAAKSESFLEYPRDVDGGPIIIPVSPSSRQPLKKQTSNVLELISRKPGDKLPPLPGFKKSDQKFPLRKSLSSECLYSSRSSSLSGDLDDDDSLSVLSRSTYMSHYEAVVDTDGYAVPNVFKRVPGRVKPFFKDETVGISPNKFLTNIKGCAGDFSQNDNVQGDKITSVQEQNLDKVNKKKMTMVKQKINQAYADLDIVAGGLSETLDRDFHVIGHVPADVNESVVEPAVLKKRIEYCTSVRLNTSKSVKRCKEYLSAIYPQLFEYCIVVGLRQVADTEGYEPYVMHKFPENRSYKVGSQGNLYHSILEVSSNLSIPNFCFPDAGIFKPGSVTSMSEPYSFVMTYSDGSRVYGYCRRIQPPDSSLPEVICIISPIDAFNMYNTLLDEIESRRRKSFELASELIAASFGRPLPKPGKVCHIRTLDASGEMETIFLTRSTDNKLENVNYESPLHYLGTDKLVKVFSSMLIERRVILCSSNLSVLTQTVHALSALLYPFQWQHVYIPLLPCDMLEVVCAPVPYIVGVLSAFLPRVLKMDLHEVFVVDLDKKNIVKSQGDEATILPKRIQKALKTAINMCKIDAEARNAQWLMVAEAFLRMFIETVGHFSNHIRTQQDGNRIFQKEGFILDVVSKEVREFLSWFAETQMFEMFIMNHVDKSDLGTSDLFLQRLAEYKESKEESSKHKGLSAKVKSFGKALKTKLQAS